MSTEEKEKRQKMKGWLARLGISAFLALLILLVIHNLGTEAFEMLAWITDNASWLADILLAIVSSLVFLFAVRSKRRVITMDKFQKELLRAGYYITTDGEEIGHISGDDFFMNSLENKEFLKNIYEEQTGKPISLKDVEYLIKSRCQDWVGEKQAMLHHYDALKKEKNRFSE